jgi:hypothetical protein
MLCSSLRPANKGVNLTWLSGLQKGDLARTVGRFLAEGAAPQPPRRLRPGSLARFTTADECASEDQ